MTHDFYTLAYLVSKCEMIPFLKSVLYTLYPQSLKKEGNIRLGVPVPPAEMFVSCHQLKW